MACEGFHDITTANAAGTAGLLASAGCAVASRLVQLHITGLSCCSTWIHSCHTSCSNKLLCLLCCPQARPLTHDLMKNMVVELGYKVTKVRVTDIIANTYYARIHVARASAPGENDEVDIDARPSDAINLAVRFGAPVYVSKRIAELAAPVTLEPYHPSNESDADIVRSVRETLSNYEDPTIMYQLQKELAVKEERFEDAQQFQENIVHEMTHNRLLRLVVAMESALADGRYEEAAHLRDEYKKAVQQQATQAPADR